MVTDAVTDLIDGLKPGDALFDELFPLIITHLPAKLSAVAGDRVRDRFPLQYQRNAIATALASDFVYSEGIHAVEIQQRDQIAGRVVAYYREQRKVMRLVEQLEADSSLEPQSKASILHLLRKGGARSALNIF